MEEQSYRRQTETFTPRRPPDGWDPFKHVLWCFHEDSQALRDALHELESEWEGREAAKSSRLKRQLLQRFAVVLLLVGVCISYVIELDTESILSNISWSSLPVSLRAQWVSVVASVFLATAVQKVDSTYDEVAPLVPLVMQLEGQPPPQQYALTFKLRERSSQQNAHDDWQALLQLQRQCALPIRASTAEALSASYVVAETVPDRSPIIQIPRSMMLSTLYAPTYVRDNCWLDAPANAAGVRQPCEHNELMAFLLILEKQLQREAVREFRKVKVWKRLDLESLPPLPYCLTKTNRKNAPFFTAAQWEAIELLTPYGRMSVERVMTKMKTAFDYASDLARSGLLVGNAMALQKILQIPEEERDKTLIDLDIRDAVSLVYNKGLADMDGEVAIAPAAYEFEAQLNVYSWASSNKMWYRPDEMGLTWRARGDYLVGSEIEVNHGRLSNLETIYRFGIKVPDNPWGPVFFLRRGAPDGPSVSFGAQGWVSVHAQLVQTTTEAEHVLPHGLLSNRIIHRHGTMCFHRGFQAEEHFLGCPPTTLGGSSVVNKNAQGLENPVNWMSTGFDNASVEKKSTTRSHLVFECDYRTTFNIFPFGYGSIMLHKYGPVGGLSRMQYQCLRAMLVEEAAGETNGDARGGPSLMIAEERIASVLQEVCSLQLGSARQAARILGAELKRQKAKISDVEEECSRREQTRSSCTADHGDVLFLEKERDIDTRRRVADVTQMMLDATNEFENLLQQCVSYFELVIKDIEMWKHVGLEF